MSFPFEFVERGGRYDFIGPLINLSCNAALVAAGGISLGVISYYMLFKRWDLMG